jgi:excisionase family DNA binding protein
MTTKRQTVLTTKEACEYLRISEQTLGKAVHEGKLVPARTPGGHFRFTLRILNDYLLKSRR